MDFTYSVLTADGSDNSSNVIAWDLTSGTQQAVFKDGTTQPRTLNIIDKSYLVSGQLNHQVISFWSLSKNNQFHKKISLPGKVRCLAVSGNSPSIVYAGIDDSIYVWEFATGFCIAVLRRHIQNVNVIRSNSQGFVSGGEDGQVMMWVLSSCYNHGSNAEPEQIWHEHGDAVSDVCTSDDSFRTVSTSRDRTMCVYTQHCPVQKFELSSPGSSVCCNESDNRIFVGLIDGKICQIDAASQGGKLPALTGHTARVICLVVCQMDDNCLVSGSEDKTARVWDISSAYCVHVFKHNGSVNAVLVVPSDFINTSNNHHNAKDAVSELIPVPNFARFQNTDGSQSDLKQHLTRSDSLPATKMGPTCFDAGLIRQDAEAEDKVQKMILINHQLFDYAMRRVLTTSRRNME